METSPKIKSIFKFLYSRRNDFLAVAFFCYALGCGFGAGIHGAEYTAVWLINVAICSIMLALPSEKPVTAWKFVNIFIYFFFLIANAVQYGMGGSVTSFEIVFSDSRYLQFQLLTLAILVIFNGLYILLGRRRRKIRRRSHDKRKEIAPLQLLILSAAATVIFLCVIRFDVAMLFSRYRWSGFMNELSDSSLSPLMHIISQILRPIPVCCLIVVLLGGCRSRKISVLLWALAIFTSFPTGLPRFICAALWLPVVFIVLSRWCNSSAMTVGIVGGIMLFFPLLEQFRFSDAKESSFHGAMQYYNTLNFDASQMMMSALEADTVTNGRQLAGAGLFFVPRRIWPEKPEGSGYLIARHYSARWLNVSMPLFAEGYLNFGWFGFILFTSLTSVGAREIDNRLDFSAPPSYEKTSMGYLILLIALSLYILRGSLLTAFGSAVALMICYFICRTASRPLQKVR